MMKDICAASLAELKTLLDEGSVTSIDIVRALKAAYQADEKQTTPLHGFIEFFDDAEAQAEKADALRKEGKTANKPLLGLPFAVKDNISIRGKLCTCCSKILDGYRAPYSATVITRLMEAGAIPIGRANMDEFAMGSSTEYSVYGPSHNPVEFGRFRSGSCRLSSSVCARYGNGRFRTASRFVLRNIRIKADLRRDQPLRCGCIRFFTRPSRTFSPLCG